MTGVFSFDINGKKRGFKFGTYGYAEACEKENCDLDELLARVGFGQVKRKPKLKAIIHLYYGAAVQYAEDNGQDIDFSVANVAGWLDYLGAERIQQMLLEGIKQPEIKNGSPSLTSTVTEG